MNSNETYIESATRITIGDTITHPVSGKRVTLIETAPSRIDGTRAFWGEGARGGIVAVAFSVTESIEVHNR